MQMGDLPMEMRMLIVQAAMEANVEHALTLGCVCTDPWSAAWTCTRTTVALNQYTGMQNFSWDWDWFPDPSSQGGSLLQTNYIDEPPDGGMLKCRLTNFDDATRYSFSRRTWTPMSPPITSQELCDAMSKTLKSTNWTMLNGKR